MITLEQIQIKLAQTIKQSGLTQTEIGRQLGISQSTISHYTKGNKMPALDTFANLCAILDADPAEILCINEYGAPIENKPKMTPMKPEIQRLYDNLSDDDKRFALEMLRRIQPTDTDDVGADLTTFEETTEFGQYKNHRKINQKK
jgi:transcriptional regulator with XRE-family HTH domain